MNKKQKDKIRFLERMGYVRLDERDEIDNTDAYARTNRHLLFITSIEGATVYLNKTEARKLLKIMKEEQWMK